MITHEDDVDMLLKARGRIDEQLHKRKNMLTVLFTDIAGSTSFFERNGDTAGLAMISVSYTHLDVYKRQVRESKLYRLPSLQITRRITLPQLIPSRSL